MIQQYHELDGDGRDPGLGDLAFDGTEYELDEFGERIGEYDSSDDYADDFYTESKPEEGKLSNTSTDKIEHGFGETINPETNPHIDDQLADDRLRQEAEADYSNATHSASQKNN